MKRANNERRKITEVKRNDQQIYVTREKTDHTKIYDITLTEKGDNQIISCAMTIKGQESATNKVEFTFDNGDAFEYNVIAKHQITYFPTQKELSKEETDHYLKYLVNRDLKLLIYFTHRAIEKTGHNVSQIEKIEINDENYNLKTRKTVTKILADNLIYQNNEFDQRLECLNPHGLINPHSNQCREDHVVFELECMPLSYHYTVYVLGYNPSDTV